jgi:ribosomal protein S27AE
MCIFFGWIHGTKVVRRYIHLSEKELDNTLLSIGQGKQIQQEEYQLKTSKYRRCSEILRPNQHFCSRCGLMTKHAEQYATETKLQQENIELKSPIKSIREEMNAKINLLIQTQNDLMQILKYPKKLAELAETKT